MANQRSTRSRRSLLIQSAATALCAALPRSVGATGTGTALESLAEAAVQLGQLHSLIAVQDGEEIFAKAFRGPALDQPVNVKSVSKTIVALLTGIAIERGDLPGPETTLGELVPELIPAGADARVSSIRLTDLLTMRAGLERTSGQNYGAWVQSSDWVAYALSRPFVTDAGSRFQYSTGSFHVLGAVLAQVTGRNLLDLARMWLGDPLEIAIPAWTRDPQGYYMGGNNMALSPRALARIGQTVLSNGKWRGVQVIPAEWIGTSWQARTRSPYSGDAYGYGWFLTQLAGEEFAYARGYGGQMLYVAPDLGLTVAVTSDPTRPARSGGYISDLNALVANRLLPIAKRSSSS